ncbi:MAG: cache domain-containing protein [Candidatus Andersenbacteria bacterium]|nr:cache domain-containing protein [Candidatus Andersenbacteria bacterium]
MPLAALFIFSLSLAAAICAALTVGRLIIHITRGRTSELTRFAAGAALLAFAWLIEAIDALPAIHASPLSLLFAPLGPAWYAEHLLLAAATFLLVTYTWHYISLRLLPQFYLSMVAIGLVAFVLSTVIFTTVLFRSAEAQALQSIEADVRTFALALQELTDRTAFTAAAMAREALVQAAEQNSADKAASALGDPITAYSVGAAYVVNAGGELILAAGAERTFGVSLASDPVVKRVLEGEVIGSPVLEDGPENQAMLIRAGSPLIRDGQVVGAVLVDTPLDIAFVDRIGQVTGLDVTVFAQQQRAATTLRDDAGQPLVPASMEDPALADTVLNQGQVFRSASTIAAKPYFIAALPITTIDDARIGALTAGLSAQTLIDNLARSTRASFLTAFALLAIALAPFYVIARLLTKSVAESR